MGMGLALTRADREWIEQRALAAGFDLAGVAAVPESSSAPASENDQRYTQWIDAGLAGEMDYLKRTDDAGEYLRGDLRRSIPWARSVIVCAVNYNAAAPKSIDPADSKAGWIARYAWSGREDAGSTRGSDYHDVLLHQLRVLESEFNERFGALLCGYRAAGGASVCGARGRRLDWQEHLRAESAGGILAAPWRDGDIA